MPVRKSFLLRVDAAVLEAMQRWANDDLRSLNGQIEYVLREALRRGGRSPRRDDSNGTTPDAVPSSPSPPEGKDE